jgi:hypothetical protein
VHLFLPPVSFPETVTGYPLLYAERLHKGCMGAITRFFVPLEAQKSIVPAPANAEALVQ